MRGVSEPREEAVAYQAHSYPVKCIDRILGEARKVRPPTKRELTDPYWAYHYAKYAIVGRWPEGEEAIATDPLKAYLYAKDVIKGRWPEGEATIATDPHQAYHYARYVIKGRWPEAEESIATDPEDAKRYLELFPEAKREWVMRGWLDWFDL